MWFPLRAIPEHAEQQTQRTVMTHFAKLTEHNSKLLIYHVKNMKMGGKVGETGLCV